MLQDGTLFWGKSIAGEGTAYGEVCFNTGMTGYQEIFTDPSYFGQIMVTTNAHIGNYGVKDGDNESSSCKISGLACRNFSYHYSRPSAKSSLLEFFRENKLFGITGVDTRALVSHIREHGAMNAVISTRVEDLDSLKRELSEKPDMKGLELASKVSVKEPYYFGNPEAPYKIAALDLGIKNNILESLAARGCYVKVLPHNATFLDAEQWRPDGYFISNGPGDPEPLREAVSFAEEVIKAKKPLFGICLGHQIIGLASGISTFKMHHGHRGINHPVMNLDTQRGEITSQNHGFAIDKQQALQHDRLKVSHFHMNDETVAGIEANDGLCFSVQYHPEASPGPHDAQYLFDKFMKIIKNNKNNQ